MKSKYRIQPCDGPRMESLLNDMHSEGYDYIESHLVGVKQVENALMPNKSSLNPMLLCIFQRRLDLDA